MMLLASIFSLFVRWKLKYVMQYINGERIVTPDGYINRRTFMISFIKLTKRCKEKDEAGLGRKEKRLLRQKLSNLCKR